MARIYSPTRPLPKARMGTSTERSGTQDSALPLKATSKRSTHLLLRGTGRMQLGRRGWSRAPGASSTEPRTPAEPMAMARYSACRGYPVGRTDHEQERDQAVQQRDPL